MLLLLSLSSQFITYAFFFNIAGRSQAAITGVPLVDLVSDAANHTNQSHSNQQQIVTPMEAQANLQQVEERERQLQKLESDIITVNDIFTQLNSLVTEQGEVIDSIENNVESAVVQVAKADRELQQAVKHKRSARKKKNRPVLSPSDCINSFA